MTGRVLRRDEVWRGHVRLDADVFIPQGRSLRLAPGCRVTATSGAKPMLTVEGELLARGGIGRPVVLEVPVETAGGRVTLTRCVARGTPVALNLGAGRHRLERVTLLGAPTGLAAHHGEAELVGVIARGCATAAYVSAGGRLDWVGGGADAGALGVHVMSGHARLRELRFSRLREALRLEGGAAEARDLRARDMSGPAVGLHGGGFALLSGIDAGAGTALAVEAGHAHLERPLTGRCEVAPDAWLCVAAGAVADEPSSVGRRFVLRTANALSGVYRALGAACVGLFAAWARRLPWVAGAWAHRSWAVGGWEPGHSDIDLALSARARTPKDVLAGAQALHARARAVFPALGELSLATEPEWAAAAASGLPRPAEWRRGGARLLSGRLPPVPSPSAAASRAGARLEAATAFSRVMQVCFSPGLDEARVRREAAKSAMDVLRYLSPEGLAGRALSRESFRDGLRTTAPEWAQRVAELERGHAHDGACRLAAALARRLSQGVLTPGAAEERRPRDGAVSAGVELARRDLDGALRGALFDTLHHSYAVIEADLPEERLALGLAAWSRRAKACGTRGALPVILYPDAWALWRSIAYHDLPLASAEEPPAGAQGAGADFPGATRFAWGRVEAAALATEDVAAAVLQSAANLRTVRRLMGRDALCSPAARHLLLSRTAALALLRRGVRPPSFDLDAALAALDPLEPAATATLRQASRQEWSGFDAAFDVLLPCTPAGVPATMEINS